MAAADFERPVSGATRTGYAGLSTIKGRTEIVLTADITAAAAFQTIARACIHQFHHSATPLAHSDDVEALHQARVALRRLRSALAMFKPMLRDDRYEPLREELKWLATTLGVARNIDVFIMQLGDAPHPRSLLAARRKAHAQARSALASSRANRLMRDLSKWLTSGDWLYDPETAALRDEPAEQRARFILDRLWKRLKRRGRDLAELDNEARHRARIEAKKLRYAADFFDALYDGKTAKQRKKAFGKAIEALQDSLGDLNDLVIAPTLCAKFSIAGMAFKQARRRLLAKAERRYDRLMTTKRFWR